MTDMAETKRKYGAYLDNRKAKREMAAAEKASRENSAAEEMSEEDAANERKAQIMMQAALQGGNFDSSDVTKNALKAYNQLMLQGASVAQEAGIKPDSKDYDDFIQYYAYMMWPQDMPISYEDFYNANSKRLETIKASEMEAQRKASDQKVADFSAAMQQYDPITGMPLGGDGRVADTFSGGANADNRLIGNAGAVSIPDDWFSGFRGRLQQDKEYAQQHPNEKWGSASEWFNYG